MTSEALKAELALREEPQAVMLSSKQLTYIANTSFVPAAFRGKIPEILACVSTGRSLGLADMTALRSIHIIDGKATFSAELMVQLVRKHGHSLTGEISADQAVARGRRADNGDEMTATFTIEMAKRAGLLDKKGNSWKHYPEAMLWARAVSQLCRMLFADCFAGATYTPEEGEQTADELMNEAPLAEAIPSGAQAAGRTDEPEPSPLSGSASDEPLEGEVVDEPDPGLFIVPDGYQGAGKPLAEVAEGPAGPEWMAWAADNAKDTGLREAATAFLGRLA